MLQKYWEQGIGVETENIRAVFAGENLRHWQMFRDFNPGKTDHDLVTRALAITTAGIAAHVSGIGPYVDTMFAPQVDAFDLAGFPNTSPIAKPEADETTETVAVTLSGLARENLAYVRNYAGDVDPAIILRESMHIALVAEQAEADPNGPGFFMVSRRNTQIKSLFEILQFGRYAPKDPNYPGREP